MRRFETVILPDGNAIIWDTETNNTADFRSIQGATNYANMLNDVIERDRAREALLRELSGCEESSNV